MHKLRCDCPVLHDHVMHLMTRFLETDPYHADGEAVGDAVFAPRRVGEREPGQVGWFSQHRDDSEMAITGRARETADHPTQCSSRMERR
jgi:hypothetical protein